MGWNHDPDAIHSHQSGEIHALPEKSTPVDDDLLLIEDSADSNSKKKVKLSNLGGGAKTLDDLTDVDTTGVADGDALGYDANTTSWVPGGGGGGGNHIVPFSWSGELQTSSGTHRLVFADNATLVAVVASCGVAPAGAAVIVDVNLNGTTIFTTQANRPTIADGGNQSAVATPDVTAVSAGDYLTVDIDQVGSSDPGEDLTVSIVWSN